MTTNKIVSNVVNTAPERIFLDLGFDLSDENDLSFKELSDVTWSEDNATGYGIEYVRVDKLSDEWLRLCESAHGIKQK